MSMRIIPYSRKIWRGIKFGGLAIYYYNRQIKIRQNFLLTYIRMAIPYQTAKFKSANILSIAILGSTAKFKARQYFRLYDMIKWLIRHTHSQNERCTHPQLNCFPDDTKRACHRRAHSKMEWIYTRTKVSGHGSLDLAQENKERLTNGYFFNIWFWHIQLS